MKALNYLKDKGRFLIAFVSRCFRKSQEEICFRSYLVYKGKIHLLQKGLYDVELNKILFLKNHNKAVYVSGITVDHLKFEQYIKVKDCENCD